MNTLDDMGVTIGVLSARICWRLLETIMQNFALTDLFFNQLVRGNQLFESLQLAMP